MFAILLHEDMNPFYENISSFPTVFFTLLLMLCILFWFVSVLGFVDIDFLDIDGPDADATGPDALAGILFKLGLNGVPVTIILTLIALIGWTISYYVVHFFFGIIPDGILRYAAGLPVFLGSAYVAIMLTAQIIKPLRPLFKKATRNTVKQILGQTAIVRTSRVDKDFGEASLEDGGAGLIIKVRARSDDNFGKGDRVVLLEHNKEMNTYIVVSEEEFSGSAAL